MRPLRLCAVALFTTMVSWIPFHALAAVTVDINGTSATPANLALDYGPFTITAAVSGYARVDASDASPDSLRFHNVVITADEDNASGHITFYETFNPGPSGNVNYETTVSGTMKRGSNAAELSSFSYGAQVVHPTDNTYYEQIGSTVYDPDGLECAKVVPDLYGENPTPANYGNITTCNRQETIYTPDPRLMRGEFYFTLKKSGDKLTFPSGSGILIKGSASGGDGRPPDPKESCNEMCQKCKECSGVKTK